MDLSFKNVMKVYKLVLSDLDDMRKYQEILRTLGIKEYTDLGKLINYIFQARFVSPNTKSDVDVFEYLKDYDLIYAIFRKDYGINLQTDDIQWWEFTFMLEEIMLGDNALTKRMGYRAYKTPSKIDKDNKEQHKFYANMRLKYQITQKEQDVNKSLGRMFKSLERK